MRIWIRLSLAALLVPVALTAASANGAAPRPGAQYFGATSQGGNVVAQVTRDGGRVAWLELELRARCVGRQLVHPVKAETVFVRGLAVDAGGRFGRFGRLARFDSGPGGIGERFPVVVTGRLAGGFPASRRLEGTVRLRLEGRFYLGGGSGEGFDGERATCRTGGIRFSAELPRESRSRVGALRELRHGSACVFSRPRAGCRRMPGLGAPDKILLSRDGRHVYVAKGQRNAPGVAAVRVAGAADRALTDAASAGCDETSRDVPAAVS